MDKQLAIRILSGAGTGRTFRLGNSCFIGQAVHCEIQLQDPGIAPMQARIDLRGSGYNIVDLSDGAGLKVNGFAVKSRKIQEGDRISLAGVQIGRAHV